MSIMPIRYNDPMYARLARVYEAQYGLPAGILDAIRNMGERSNANQVSSAGAQTPYQFIPATRQGMIKNYGVDPWQSADSATHAAAQLLAENYGRTGSWDSAVGMYHGGTNRQNWGPKTRAYMDRVGEYDMGQSRYPAPYYGGVDPLAPLPAQQPTSQPEAPTQPVPIPGSPSPSISMPTTAPVTHKKRGGILGALESVFMPEPDSLWAAALRGGIWDAKTNQQLYRQYEAKNLLDVATANAKLQQMMTKGEYEVVGNNVLHKKPDGSVEWVSPPDTPDKTMRLYQAWVAETDPQKKDMLGHILLQSNDPSVLAQKAATAVQTARIRAGATTGAARIRTTTNANTLPPLPPGAKVIH